VGKRPLSYIVTLTIGLAACTTQYSGLSPTPSVAVSAQAVCPEQFGPFDGSCEFDLGDLRVAVNGHGKGTIYRGSKVLSRFVLPIEDGYLDRLYYLDYGGDLLIIFGASDGESGWGGVVRVDPRDASTRWALQIPAFNVGPVTLERASLYVTGIGFVARVDARSGQYVWKHEHLYCEANGAFNAFEAPRLTPTDAWFEEATLIARPRSTIRVSKADGHPLLSLTDRCSGPAAPATER
jgi:hypothetical protein